MSSTKLATAGWPAVRDAAPLPQTTKVLIVDDHELVRCGLASFLGLAHDVDVVGQASSGAEAVSLARRLRPDVVLMDLMLPDMEGPAAIRATKEAVPDTQIIALTSFHSDELVWQALQAGAIGYLLKDIGALGLGEAIRAARAGRSTLAAEAAQAVVKHSISQTTSRPQQSLTRREREVLQLLVDGLTNAQIAQRLVISRATANFHVSSILAKLDVESRTKAVALALQDRLVD
jgi:two-component system, NarL family, response regulator LiaR